MITSRYNPELENQIEPSARLEIRASNEDIDMYFEHRMKKESRLKGHTKNDPELRLLVKNTIREKAQNMYVSSS